MNGRDEREFPNRNERADWSRSIGADSSSRPDEAAAMGMETDPFDAELGRAIRNVPIPEGLVARLQAAVNPTAVNPTASEPVSTNPVTVTSEAGTGKTGDEVGSTNADVPQAKSSPMNRLWPRRLMGMALGIGVLALMAPVVLPRLWPASAQLSESDIPRLAALNVESLPFHSNSRRVAIPYGWRLRELELGEARNGAAARAGSIPLIPVTFRAGPRSGLTTGLLAVLPQTGWPSGPIPPSFGEAPVRYASFGSWTVWRERNAVYVVIFLHDTSALERLQQQVTANRDVT